MNEPETELLKAVRRVVSAFDSLGVEYLIGGSVASTVMGEPRQTIDADLVARLLAPHAEPLISHLGKEFYAELSSITSAIKTQGSFNLIHLETMTKMDVFVRWRDPFGASQLARRQLRILGGGESGLGPLKLFFASPEDVVLAKLEWFRKGGEVSDRQWRDLLGVIKVQGLALDRAYLQHWAGELGVLDLLGRAFTEAS